MVDNHKVSNLLDRIKFGHMDTVKTTVLADSQMFMSFPSTTHYFAQFFQNKNKVHVRKNSISD